MADDAPVRIADAAGGAAGGARGSPAEGRAWGPARVAGGPHLNKLAPGGRLRHLPSGLVVSSQQVHSQHNNKPTAMKMLKAALYQRAVDEREKKKQAVEATKADASWGNQIRSYVFQPYTMVNDHRTSLKVPDVQRVMDGDLDRFIEAYLKQYGSRAA